MSVLIVAIGFCQATAFAEPPINALYNPGFEAVQSGQLSGWSTPEYWFGSVAPVADEGAARSGKRSARLTSAGKQSRHWGRVLQSVRLRDITARRFRYSIWARGSGEFLLGCIEYRSPERHEPHYKYRWQANPVDLGSEWREVVFEFAVPDPEVRHLAVVAEVRGEGSEALLDDAALVRSQEPGVCVVATPSHAMAPVGQTLDVRIKVEKNGQPLESGKLVILTMPPDLDPVSTEAKISSDGVTVHTYDAPPDAAMGIHRLVIAHPASGAVVECYVDLTDQETWERFAAAAGQAKIEPAPAHLLFIGDSLTDQQRGHNYVDKLAFWLQRSCGSTLTYRNAGVGGDFISRVWQRMDGDPKAYRLSMYDDLFEPKPTHVFFFLGHNDSKVSSLSGYTRHCVDPDTFEREYRLAVRKVQNQTGAKVIVISATSSVFEICSANADKRRAAGKPHNLFGKPEELEKFNAIAKRIAAELGADYVDVYDPTRTHSDKQSLFNPGDGVHLTNTGNRFIAHQLLEHLGRK
ncbi:MAG: hypothetical protein HQ582_12740 [Planctomycetes bacterium]|nr:hypothetical protein [Planctomycetota bacterium]